MKQRINYFKIAPEALKLMVKFEEYAKTTDFDPLLIELIKMRASQINGCAYCLDMHTIDARALGETEQRIYTLSVWRDTDFFSEKEKIVLELTEIITNISENEVSDELFERMREIFSDKQIVDLIILINTINSWNRLAIAFKNEPGHYKTTKK